MSYTLISAETRKARKQHPCSWCGQKIERGETYEFSYFIFDGDAQSNKFHKECDAACSAAACEEGGEFEFTPNGVPMTPTVGVSEEQIHAMCNYLQGHCHKCPKEIDTAYGRGEQGCHAIALETLEKAQSLLAPTSQPSRGTT